MCEFIGLLRSVNTVAKVILTVSPVPLIATAEDRHVLVATTYSKSVLRVACDALTRALRNVAYFPSYEIITGPHARGHYFARDLRSITEAGVSHVMRLFLAHYGDSTTSVPQQPVVSEAPEEPDIAALVAVMCDEEALVAPAAT
jgi:hypothetical protein